jgi:uncharacterized protein YjbJ (UPF0337 family)
MEERGDELKGNIKQGIGKMTGNEDLEAEGRIERDSAKAQREVKGAGTQLKGSVQEGIGKIAGDEEMQARGTADRLKGEADRAG